MERSHPDASEVDRDRRDRLEALQVELEDARAELLRVFRAATSQKPTVEELEAAIPRARKRREDARALHEALLHLKGAMALEETKLREQLGLRPGPPGENEADASIVRKARNVVADLTAFEVIALALLAGFALFLLLRGGH